MQLTIDLFHKVLFGACAVLVLLLIVGTILGVREHIDKVAAGVRADTIAAEKQKQIDSNTTAETERDKKLNTFLDTINTSIKGMKDAGQARTALQPIFIPAGVAPIAPTQVEKKDLPANMQAEFPDAPSTTKFSLVTDPQMIALGKAKLACDAKDAELTTCKANLATETDSKNKALEKATAYQDKPKKRTVIKNCAVRVGLGALAGVFGKSSRDAEIGAGIGLGSCFVF